jgi:hypothetical protein
MVVRVAKRYGQLKRDFCIITFYDPQRAAISRALENENLASDCVYNVDSFQGMSRWGSLRLQLADLKSLGSVRERSGLRDLVFRSDKATRILEFAAAHERRSDPLS